VALSTRDGVWIALNSAIQVNHDSTSLTNIRDSSNARHMRYVERRIAATRSPDVGRKRDHETQPRCSLEIGASPVAWRDQRHATSGLDAASGRDLQKKAFFGNRAILRTAGVNSPVYRKRLDSSVRAAEAKASFHRVTRLTLIKRQPDCHGNSDQPAGYRYAGNDNTAADTCQLDAQTVCRFDGGIMQSIL